jgi:cystathionine beta-lyase/cystathionine gamma-synthase
MIWHPASMTHEAMPKVKHEMMYLADPRQRVSPGIWDWEDMPADFAQGFGQIWKEIDENTRWPRNRNHLVEA